MITLALVCKVVGAVVITDKVVYPTMKYTASTIVNTAKLINDKVAEKRMKRRT